MSGDGEGHTGSSAGGNSFTAVIVCCYYLTAGSDDDSSLMNENGSSSGINCRNNIMDIYRNDSSSFAAHSNEHRDIGSVCCQIHV